MFVVVVDEAGGLEMRINSDGADVFEAAGAEVGADFGGETVAGGNVAVGMFIINDDFAIGVAP